MAKNINIKKENGKIYIYTPYNKQFVSAIKNDLGGRWNGEAWVIHEDAVNRVREILMDIYGETDLYTPDRVNVRLRFESTEEIWRDVFSEFGRDIIIATGRDSGAWTGTDCSLDSGEITSGGSLNNWLTIIRAGACITVYGVSKPQAEKVIKEIDAGEYEYDMTCEIISDPKANFDELREEKARLLARIAEIDEILKNEE